MNEKKHSLWSGLGKCTRWNLVVPIGAILIFLIFAALAQNEQAPVPKEKKQSSKTEKTPPQDMKEIRDLLGKLRELGEKRTSLRDRQEKLLEDLPELKKDTEDENLKPDRIMARKDLEKIAGELHKSLEQDRKLAREQHELVQKLMEKKEAAITVISRDRKNLESRILKAQKEPEPDQDKIKQWKQQVEELEKIQTTLEILEKNPDALLILGLRPGNRPPQRESDEWYPGKYLNRRMGRQPMEKPDMERAGGRIIQQMTNLQKQVRFLRGELDHTETELNSLQALIKRIQEQHPEFFEEIRDEIPPPPREPAAPQNPVPDSVPKGKEK